MADTSEHVVEAALSAVVRDHGWRVATEPTRLRASLSDVLGSNANDHRGAVDALVISVDEGSSRGDPYCWSRRSVRCAAALASRLAEWGLSAERTEWTIQAWGQLLPETTAPPPLPTTDRAPPSPDGESTPSNIVTVAAAGVPMAEDVTQLPEHPPAPAEPLTELPPPAEQTPDLTALPEPRATSDLTATPEPVATYSPVATAANEPADSATAGQDPNDGTPVGRRIAMVVAALASVAVAGTLLFTAFDSDGTEDAPDAEVSPTTAATVPPQATAGEVVASSVASPDPVTETVAMGAKKGGVQVLGMSETDTVGAGEDGLSAPEGGSLVAFSLDTWPCEVETCKEWDDLDLQVDLDGQAQPLPASDDGVYVVAVPEGNESVDLTMTADGLTQSLSLLTGEPGTDNIQVLARSRADRTQKIDPADGEFTLIETTNIAFEYEETTTNRVEKGPPSHQRNCNSLRAATHPRPPMWRT